MCVFFVFDCLCVDFLYLCLCVFVTQSQSTKDQGSMVVCVRLWLTELVRSRRRRHGTAQADNIHMRVVCLCVFVYCSFFLFLCDAIF